MRYDQLKQRMLYVQSQLLKSEEKNQCWAEISAVRLYTYRGCTELGTEEMDGVLSVCFQRQLENLLQQRQYAAQRRKNGEIHFFFLHAFLKNSAEVQLQHSSNIFLSNELMEVLDYSSSTCQVF